MRIHRQENTDRSQRQIRVAEQLKQVLTETLRRGKFFDAAAEDMVGVSISEVRISPDLKNATVYISVLGGDEDMKGVAIPALNRSEQFFKQDIRKKLRMRYTPNLRFEDDSRYDEAARINALIAEIDIPDEEEGEDDGR